jgi:hypothetical protein
MNLTPRQMATASHSATWTTIAANGTLGTEAIVNIP